MNNEAPAAEQFTENNTAYPAMPQFGTNDNADEISLIELILLFWRGKLIIAATTLFFTILGVVYAFVAPESFSSFSHFILKTGKSGTSGQLGQLAALAGMPIGSSGGSIDPSDYLDKVISDGDFLATLFARKWLFKGDSLLLDEILQIEPDTTIVNWEYIHHMRKYDQIRNGKIISIKKDAKIGTLTLTTNAPSPQLAYDLNKHTLDYISAYIRGSIQSQAKEKRTFIEERLREVTRDLDNSEVSLARHRERNFASISPHVSLEAGRLTRQVSMNQELYLQLMKQFEAVKVEELDDMTLVQILRYPEIPILRSKPKRKNIVIGAFGAGALIGCGLVFVWRMFPEIVRYSRRMQS
ncbi:MAG: hypothetical protein LBI42_04855 [Chitinispirillales bacterium]|jgi:uncharacterized protein involved in exopolysaccharide biosynthesis|nr:hypothetical protein [Chitinispirillales bacterium]